MPQPTDHRLNRALGVIAFALLMALIWTAGTDPDVQMLSMSAMGLLVLLILVLLGLTDHAHKIVRAWRGFPTDTQEDEDMDTEADVDTQEVDDGS